MDEAAQRGHAVIDHAFERGIELGAMLIAFAAIAVLVVRWISARFFQSKARLTVN
jgi:hypothetical protein